jgi:hypothetical protein
MNPNSMTAPIFRTSADAELTAKIYARVPVLIDDTKGKEGNPWGVSFIAMFHMSSDSGLFRTAAQLREAGFVRDGTDWVSPDGTPSEGSCSRASGNDHLNLAMSGRQHYPKHDRHVPLYEAKMIHQFDHRWATYNEHATGDDDARYPSPAERNSARFEITPRYWAPESEVATRLLAKGWTRGWLLGHRGITNATNERTLVTAVFPTCAAGHSLPIWLPKQELAGPLAGALTANTASLVLDFVVRQKVGGSNLNFFHIKQFPILTPSSYTLADLVFIVPRVLELTYTSHSMASFARDLQYDGPPFAWDEDRRAQMRAQLDAWYARAYGLSRDELRYILDPGDVKGSDYPSETFRGLKANEIQRFREYRTAHLVLQAWDRMERDELAAVE